MPALVDRSDLTARINFVKHRSEFQDALESYLTFDVHHLPPTEELDVPIYNLREGIERGLPSVEEQLDTSGFAVIQHTSKCDLGASLDTVRGTDAYLSETVALLKDQLGASQVLVWNSVVRRNNSEVVSEDKEARQLVPEKDAPPAKSVKAAARQAHVDQDEDYARVICKRAAGDDVFSRHRKVQIINLWRPLHGPVTNAPLAVCDYRTLDVKDNAMHFASVYGTGLGISHNPAQKWFYVTHQMPHESLLLKCFDSSSCSTHCPDSSKAHFAAHVACDVFGEPDIGANVEIRPRESVEVRLVVLYE